MVLHQVLYVRVACKWWGCSIAMLYIVVFQARFPVKLPWQKAYAISQLNSKMMNHIKPLKSANFPYKKLPSPSNPRHGGISYIYRTSRRTSALAESGSCGPFGLKSAAESGVGGEGYIYGVWGWLLWLWPTTPTTMSAWMILMAVFESHLRMLTDLNSVSKNNDGFQKKSAGFQGLMFKWTMLAFRVDSRLISKMQPEWQATRWRNCYRDSLEQFSGMPGHGDVRSKDGCMEQIFGWNFTMNFKETDDTSQLGPNPENPHGWNGRWLPSEFDFCHPNHKFHLFGGFGVETEVIVVGNNCIANKFVGGSATHLTNMFLVKLDHSSQDGINIENVNHHLDILYHPPFL